MAKRILNRMASALGLYGTDAKYTVIGAINQQAQLTPDMVSDQVVSILKDAGAIGIFPSATTPPVVTGTPKVGETLTVSNGVWTENPTIAGYQWFSAASSSASLTAVTGETNKTLVLKTADATKYFACRVDAVNSTGMTSYISARVGPVAAA